VLQYNGCAEKQMLSKLTSPLTNCRFSVSLDYYMGIAQNFVELVLPIYHSKCKLFTSTVQDRLHSNEHILSNIGAAIVSDVSSATEIVQFFFNPLLFASCTDTFSKWCKITGGMKRSAQ
jgi:hypothetical protein